MKHLMTISILLCLCCVAQAQQQETTTASPAPTQKKHSSYEELQQQIYEMKMERDQEFFERWQTDWKNHLTIDSLNDRYKDEEKSRKAAELRANTWKKNYQMVKKDYQTVKKELNELKKMNELYEESHELAIYYKYKYDSLQKLCNSSAMFRMLLQIQERKQEEAQRAEFLRSLWIKK